MSIWFGWVTVNVDGNGYPTEEDSNWEASCFVLFTHIIYVGEVRRK